MNHDRRDPGRAVLPRFASSRPVGLAPALVPAALQRRQPLDPVGLLRREPRAGRGHPQLAPLHTASRPVLAEAPSMLSRRSAVALRLLAPPLVHPRKLDERRAKPAPLLKRGQRVSLPPATERIRPQRSLAEPPAEPLRPPGGRDSDVTAPLPRRTQQPRQEQPQLSFRTPPGPRVVVAAPRDNPKQLSATVVVRWAG